MQGVPNWTTPSQFTSAKGACKLRTEFWYSYSAIYTMQILHCSSGRVLYHTQHHLYPEPVSCTGPREVRTRADAESNPPWQPTCTIIQMNTHGYNCENLLRLREIVTAATHSSSSVLNRCVYVGAAKGMLLKRQHSEWDNALHRPISATHGSLSCTHTSV